MARAHELLQEIMELTNDWMLSPSGPEPSGSAAPEAGSEATPTRKAELTWHRGNPKDGTDVPF